MTGPTEKQIEAFMTSLFGEFNVNSNCHAWISPNWNEARAKVTTALTAALAVEAGTAEDRTYAKLETIVAPDNGTTEEVLAAVLECANAWVPEARIVGNVRAGDISRVLSALITSPASSEPETATEEQLRELYGDDEPLDDVIDTHDGTWKRAGKVWQWHPREELSVPYRVSVTSPASSGVEGEAVAWSVTGEDGWMDITDSEEIARQWQNDGFSVTALYLAQQTEGK